VNIPAIVGGTTAYVGFTAGTGGTSAIQNILDWTYTATVNGDTVKSSTSSNVVPTPRFAATIAPS
jgi:hypothetical protein